MTTGANRKLIGLHYHGATALNLTTGAIMIGDSNGAGAELAPSTNGFVLTLVTGSPAWAAPTSPTHNLLSATHPDTTAASPTRGDIITAQGASPLWTKLAKASPASGVRALLGFDNGDTEPAYKTTLDSTTPVTITAGGAGAAGTSLIFARRDHDHPAPATYAATAHNVLSATHGDSTAGSATRGDIITAQGASPTWTRLARSVPAANVLNVLGLANGDTEPAWKTVLDATAPTTIAVGDSASAGTSLVFAHRDHVHGSPTTWTATAHALLSAIHSDTTAAAVARGALIVGVGASPAWTKLVIGAANSFFGSDGTDATWTASAALTKVDDTNVTLTLGGTPTTALLRAASLTLGWTGTLAVARGGIGVGTLASNAVLIGNTTGAVQVVAVNSSATTKFLTQASSAAPAWNTIAIGDLPTITVLATATLSADKSTTSGTFSDVDATNAAVTFTSAGGTIIVSWSGPVATAGGSALQLKLNLDGVDTNVIASSSTNGSYMSFTTPWAPAAGSHTAKLRFASSNNVNSVGINGSSIANGSLIAVEYRK